MYQVSSISVSKPLFRSNPSTRWSLKPISWSLTSNTPSSSNLITLQNSKFHCTFMNSPPHIFSTPAGNHYRKYSGAAAAAADSYNKGESYESETGSDTSTDDDSSGNEGEYSESETESDTSSTDDDDSSCNEGENSESETESASALANITNQMADTPLHVASAGNNVDIVKNLLNRQGSEKVELEARNMHGETPLHMAAKNGSSEAARVLLDHGALVESKSNSGMTPLQLAIRYSLRAEDCLTVKTLLEYNADCSVRDKDGMITPINHLPEGPLNKKLRGLLNWHFEEQRNRRLIEPPTETKAKIAELEDALSDIVGLREVKLQLRKWAKGMLLDEKRRALGLKVAARRSPHMAFLGNPGTGKTKVARILGRLLHILGVLPTDKVTEVQRTDLVGKHIGHTGPKTRQKIKEAEGGILFVDEAYRLIPVDSDRDFGIEALEEIMSVMDAGKIVVIFAGYSEPMKRVITSNAGFSRRVTKFFVFNDFNSEDLAQIVHLKMNNQEMHSLLYGFKLHSSCTVGAVAKLIEEETTEKQRKEMNGGIVDTMLATARENLDFRLDYESADEGALVTITLEDLEAGLKSLPLRESNAFTTNCSVS